MGESYALRLQPHVGLQLAKGRTALAYDTHLSVASKREPGDEGYLAHILVKILAKFLAQILAKILAVLVKILANLTMYSLILGPRLDTAEPACNLQSTAQHL